MKFKIFALFALSAFLFLSLVSADANVFPDKVSGNSTTVNLGGQFQMSFVINNTFQKDLTNLRIRLPSSLTGVGSWTEAKIGGAVYPISGFTVIFPKDVPANTLSDPITLTFTVNNNALAATYSKEVSFLGDYKDGTSNIVISPLAFSITVPSSPSLSITKVKELTRSQNGTINVSNGGNTQFSSVSLTASGNIAVTLSDSNFALAPGSSRLVNVLAQDLSGLRFGSNPITITAKSGDTQTSATFSSISQSFCKGVSTANNLSIRAVDITNDGEGDDNTWRFLDKLTIDVDVENNADENINDVFVELGLFDSLDKNIVGDLDFDNTDEEKYDLGDIRHGDKETATFEFTVPADIDASNYKLSIKAFSKKTGEAILCTDTSNDLSNDIFEAIEVERESDNGKFMAFDNELLSPTEAVCGDQVTLTANVFNVGEDDEDQVKINIANRELGLASSVEIRKDLNQGDKEKFSFTFEVPQNAQSKTYSLDLTAEYDYRNGLYRQESDEAFKVPLKVVCQNSGISSGASTASINAELLSDAKAGASTDISVTIKNTGNSTASFVLGIKGYESWASLEKVSDRIFTLSPGESKDATVTFNINKDAGADESFIIEAVSGGRTETREVAVKIAPGSSLSSIFKDNGFIWFLVGFNVLLIILIIVVAVKLSRRN